MSILNPNNMVDESLKSNIETSILLLYDDAYTYERSRLPKKIQNQWS